MKDYFYRLVIAVIIVLLTNEFVFQFDSAKLIRFIFLMILISFPFALHDWFAKRRG